MSDTAISPSNGSIAITGLAPLVKDVVLIPSATGVAITGYAPSLTLFEPTVCAPSYGSIAITGYAPRLHGWTSVAAASTTWTNL